MASSVWPHIRDCIRLIDSNSWLIGDHILLSRQSEPPLPSSEIAHWSDGRGSFFTVTQVSDPSRPVQTPVPTPHQQPFEMVYEAGDKSAVFRIGKAYLKARIEDVERLHMTPEATTLALVKEKRQTHFANDPDFQFETPSPYAFFRETHGRPEEGKDRTYLFLSEVPGQILDKAWPGWGDREKQTCAEHVVSICEKFAKGWQSDKICGADEQGYITAYYLTGSLKRLAKEKRERADHCSPEALLENCTNIGMTCTSETAFMFYHCDLGASNVLVYPDTGRVAAIVDWEIAGFVPYEWIRTNVAVNSGLDLEYTEVWEERVAWRRLLKKTFGERGYPEMAEAFFTWSRVTSED